ncbi:TetR family transcriptional regulator [Rhodococcus sp. SC4]|uniref:TetR/AcrR family transcriptional regulator n=1 Tax=unclassified Rhodococcus (in: high G+C Gram-positive bacteria) TaxID=192944 RepID=UPI00076ACB7B|nr:MULTISPECIES: TetR/AcrR family transcriptional regulator [unclassified Rhodococcus (in: high G+C Gram-positive bacteria)]KXF52946.1 TetR family transcriptional regulator [Rhodococcus sp. SC4]KXX58022.1 TetR family transcriptional regulator [Rhodococcus sp. LB1]PBC57895.1 TetR family transcriptional regulator [Rhodococcus sp. ACPA1]
MNISKAGDDGTPRSAGSGHDKRRARTQRAVLDATRELLAENGFGNLTVEGVAARSGVAKTTIYRRYRSKNDLALAVLLDMVDEVSTQPYRADTWSELVILVDRTVELMCTSLMGLVMKGLVSEVAADPELAHVYRDQVVSHRLADVSALVERGISRGELRADLDPEMVTDLLLGPIYYRFFLSGAPMDDGFGRRLVTTLLPSFAA